ncbi:hypothetical protein RB595_004544 [Gaeumannomyces hyphopodioides]
MPVSTGRKRRASSSEAELRAALQEEQPSLWGWAQTILRSVYRTMTGALGFGPATGGASAPAAAAGAAQTILVVETSASSPSGDTWVKRRKAIRVFDRGEEALRKPPVRFPSGFSPKNRKFPRRKPVFAPASQPPVGQPAPVAARAVESREKGQAIARAAAAANAAATWRRRPAVAELRRVHARVPNREGASRPLPQQVPGPAKLPKTPQRPLKGILKHSATLRREKLRRQQHVQEVVTSRRVIFRTSHLPSPAPVPLTPAEFNWRGHFRVPSPSPSSSDSEFEEPSHSGPVTPLSPSPSPYTAPDLTPISHSAQHVAYFSHPAQDAASLSHTTPDSTTIPAQPEDIATIPAQSKDIATAPARPEDITPIASRIEHAVKTRQPIISTSAQAEDAAQIYSTVPAMDSSSTMSAPKRPSDSSRLAQTPMRQAPARIWNSFQTPQPSRADALARTRQVSGSSSRLPLKLFRPGLTASQRVSAQAEGPVATYTDTRVSTSSDSTPRPTASDLRDRFLSTAPDRMDVDMSGDHFIARTPYSALQSSTRKSRFRPPSHATVTPRKKSIDAHDFSLIGESPESTAPPTPEAKSTSPEARRQEMLAFFADDTRNIRAPGIETEDEVDSPNKMQQSPTTRSPAHSPDDSPRHYPPRSNSSSPATSQPNSPQAPSHSSSPPAPSKPEDDLDFPSFPALTISSDKDDELACAVQLRIEAEEEEERERARRAEEERRKAEAERLEKEEKERLERSGGLRLPNAAIVQQVSEEWHSKIMDTNRVRETMALAKSAEGTEILGRDFRQVVPATVWLNDEIVNSSLSYVAKYINDKAGTKSAVKCVLLNSYFWKHLTERGANNTQRWLRRLGVNQGNFLTVETFLIPINLGNSHWTLGIVRPKQGVVAHIDSLGPQGAGSPQIAGKLLEWVKTFLGPHYIEANWKTRDYESPSQTNSWDCGVHTITNGFCVALDIDPSKYKASDMPQQRVRLAGVLLNGGFTGDFDISDL